MAELDNLKLKPNNQKAYLPPFKKIIYLKGRFTEKGRERDLRSWFTPQMAEAAINWVRPKPRV